MKKIILTLTWACLLAFANAQAPAWFWAKSAGKLYDDQVNSVATDALGNCYAAGWFDSDTMKFGSASPLINYGACDIFLAKYDAGGNVLWARSAGGDSYDYAISVNEDASGNVYVAGLFRSDTIWFGTTYLLNSGGTDDTKDMFLVKYNSVGVVQWAKSAFGLGDDQAYSVAADASGNIYVAGFFTSFHLTFGAFMLTNTDTVSYTDDIFLVKYNSSGNEQWAKRAGAAGWDEGYSVATDASGNIYMAGIFDSLTTSIGSFVLNNTDTSGNTSDIFLAKYNSSGIVQWAVSGGGANYDQANSISADASGNVYVAGYFQSALINFNTDTLFNEDSTAASLDMFLAAYDTGGNELWAYSAGGDGDDAGFSVDVNASGEPYVAGMFSSPEIYFDTLTLLNHDANYWDDIFVVHFDADGNLQWATTAGGSSDDDCYAITVDPSGNSYVGGGFFSPVLSFGTATLTDADNTTNTEDVFVAKLGAFVGINEPAETSVNISVFPNPCADNITVSLPERSNIDIFNTKGQKIKSIIANTGNTTIDISDLAKGLYFVKIIPIAIGTNKGIDVKKFVKE